MVSWAYSCHFGNACCFMVANKKLNLTQNLHRFWAIMQREFQSKNKLSGMVLGKLAKRYVQKETMEIYI